MPLVRAACLEGPETNSQKEDSRRGLKLNCSLAILILFRAHSASRTQRASAVHFERGDLSAARPGIKCVCGRFKSDSDAQAVIAAAVQNFFIRTSAQARIQSVCKPWWRRCSPIGSIVDSSVWLSIIPTQIDRHRRGSTDFAAY